MIRRSAVVALMLVLAACLKQSPKVGPADGASEIADGEIIEPYDGAPEPIAEPIAEVIEIHEIVPDEAECSAVCGDDTCDLCESKTDCPADCCKGSCGDGVCDSDCGEDDSGDRLCVADCCVCGDDLCRYEPWCQENGVVCWSDCCEPKETVCGNGSLNFDCDEHKAGPTFCYDDACKCKDGVCADGLDGRPACGESEHTCPEDCCRCGDGQCVGTGGCGEFPKTDDAPSTCVIDCTTCGDGICAGEENYSNCVVDCCGGCGDGVCKGGECGESPATCVQDCGAGIACGDLDCVEGENPVLCPQDCKHNACGNNECEPDEDSVNCPGDCSANCGDGICDGLEDKYSCPIDCGVCGDGVFSLKLGETKENCPTDFCEDRNPCTDDSWKTENGLVVGCVHAPNTATCDDGDPCSTGDKCDSGACQPGGVMLPCDDQNPCTTDSCDKAVAGGCVHAFDAEGACTEDDNPCTTMACDAETQACKASPASGPCDDGDPCTRFDACEAGACKGSDPDPCDDKEPCQKGACVTGQGCFYNSAGTDGVACEKTCTTGTPQCSGGECLCL